MKTRHLIFVALCCIGLGCLHYLSLMHKGLTPDETTHYTYGEKVLQATPSRIEAGEVSTMPFSSLNVFLPRIFHQDTVQAGRWVTVACSLLLALIVFAWAKELYGIYAGLAAFFCYCFDPNIIAHSQLVTTDLYAALMMTASCYCFWRFRRYGGWRRGLISALVLGLAQLAKYTCLVLYPLFFIFILLTSLPWLWHHLLAKKLKPIAKGLWQLTGYSSLFIACGLLAINMGFSFYKSGSPLDQYHFASSSFQHLKTSPLAHAPLPLPTPYLEGLDLINYDDVSGNMWNIYLNGQTKHPGKGQGFKGYFLWVLWYKAPLALWIGFLAAIVVLIAKRRSRAFLRDEIYLFMPIIFFLVYYNLCISLQVGIRSILFILPLCWIFTSSLFAAWTDLHPRVKMALLSLPAYLLVSSLSYFPHFISYFNETLLNRSLAYKRLADSNLDWGGVDWYIDQYKQAHPQINFEYPTPKPGHFIVGATDLVGIYDAQRHRWLRENFEPVDNIAYAFLVYAITAADINRLYLKYQGDAKNAF